MKNISTIVNKIIVQVDNIGIRDALQDSYNDSTNSTAAIENFFQEFTSKVWPTIAKRIFLRNWRSPGYGAASFCALTFRILQLCEKENNSEAKTQLYYAVAQIAEIAHDDVGINGINHEKLYEQFAYQIAGDDEWKLNKYRIPAIQEFLTKARQYRQSGGNIQQAISLSLPEELYNHGEFLFIAPLFTKWHMEISNSSNKNKKEDLAFITAHLGTTESHHFASAVKGLKFYCDAVGLKIDYLAIYNYNQELLKNKATYFQKLMTALLEAS